MRFVYVIVFDAPSSMAHVGQTVQTARALAAAGHDVRLMPRRPRGDAPDPAGWMAERFGPLPPGLRVTPLRLRPRDAARAETLLRLALELRAAGPRTVFWARERRTAHLFLRLRRRLAPGARLVYEFHNLEHASEGWAPDDATRSRVLRAERALARGADALVATTALLAEELTRTFEPATPPVVVPSGADVERFGGVGDPFPGGGPGAPVRLVYAGSLYRHKGVDALVEALARLPARFQLALAGGHPPQRLQELRRLARERGVEGRVGFAGALPPEGVPAFLGGGDLVLLPGTRDPRSARYTSPLKLFEAMATGVPIVAHPTPAHREVISDGVDAFLARGTDGASLAERILEAAGDPARARAVGARAARAAEGYSWRARAQRVAAVAAGVLAER